MRHLAVAAKDDPKGYKIVSVDGARPLPGGPAV